MPYAFRERLGNATGFVLDYDGVPLLITNYHVVSGLRPDTGAQLVSSIPDRILLPLLRREGNDVLAFWAPHVQPLITEDGNPLWAEHPILGRRFDVAALPLRVPEDRTFAAYEKEPGVDLAAPPGSDVVIVGFPQGFTGLGITAIWKGGTIASEYGDDSFGEEPFFWIDSNTRPGMSGAPVVARRFGAGLMADGSSAVFGGGPTDRVLGVYSGRAFDAPDMTLGRVWKWDGVLELAAHAAGMVQSRLLLPRTCRLGYHWDPQMPTIRAEIVYVPVDVMKPLARIRTVDLLRIALRDQRFGSSLVNVRAAAEVDAACDASERGEPLTLSSGAARLLIEVLEAPQGWAYNPTVTAKALTIVDKLLEDLRAAAVAEAP